jgi:membrane protein DedA with SNARE-associated domain
LGAGLWSFILTAMGYFIGDNKTLIEQNLVYVTIGVISFVGLLLALYYWWQKKQAIAE